jgi:glycosyltransferase involved in cell wall biosynthesis
LFDRAHSSGSSDVIAPAAHVEAGAPDGRPAVAILGTRGIPAAHGGFETLAERLALELVGRGWRVEVYCQVREPSLPTVWRGIELIPVAVPGDGALATILFDLKCTLRAAFRPALPLVLGYNTAAFSILYRLVGKRSVMNMDGIEWRRARWSTAAKMWFWLNERFGSLFSTHLVADHPEIAKHLARKTSASRITTIVYGADPITEAPVEPLAAVRVRPRDYGLLIARIVPENLVLPIVRAWSEIRPGLPLVVLGKLTPGDAYHRCVRAAGGRDVIFAGAIYEAERVRALRLHARFHIHGHTVGGTNPSLVEALGAGSPILAHDNPFNRWVAGPEAIYFGDEAELRRGILSLVRAAPSRLDAMSAASRRRHAETFAWHDIFDAYEGVLSDQIALAHTARGRRQAEVRKHERRPA